MFLVVLVVVVIVWGIICEIICVVLCFVLFSFLFFLYLKPVLQFKKSFLVKNFIYCFFPLSSLSLSHTLTFVVVVGLDSIFFCQQICQLLFLLLLVGVIVCFSVAKKAIICCAGTLSLCVCV